MLKIGIVSLALLLGATAPAAAPGIAGKEAKEAKEAAKKGVSPASPAKTETPAEGAELEQTGEAIDQAEAAAAAAVESDPAKAAAKAVASSKTRRAARSTKMESKTDKGDKHAHAAAAPAPVTAQSAGVALPPSLSAPALHKELSAHAKAPSSADTASEREKLEALSADLARARAALQAETARLEALMKSRKGGAAAPTAGATQAGEAPSAPMPIGDPMAPPPRPAYPLPSTPPGQVDVVSKAVKGMKPEQAAALIAHLDRVLAADVLQRMKPADAGAVLGFLRPEMGAALATEIANRPASNTGKTKNSEK